LYIGTIALTCQHGSRSFWVDVAGDSSFETLQACITLECSNQDTSVSSLSVVYLSTAAGQLITTTAQAITANHHGRIVVTFVTPLVHAPPQEFTDASLNSFVSLLERSPAMLAFMGAVGSDDAAQRKHAHSFAAAVMQRLANKTNSGGNGGQ